MANKTNSSVRFLGESMVRQSTFRFYLTFKRLILRYHIYCELIYCPIHHFHVYLILSNKMLIFLSLSSLLSSNFFEMSWRSLNITKRGWYTSSNSYNFTDMSFEQNLCVNIVLDNEFTQIISFEFTFQTLIMASQNYRLLANFNWMQNNLEVIFW